MNRVKNMLRIRLSDQMPRRQGDLREPMRTAAMPSSDPVDSPPHPQISIAAVFFTSSITTYVRVSRTPGRVQMTLPMNSR